MKRFKKFLPFVFVLMLIGGLFSCNENEDIEEQKQPDQVEVHDEYTDGTICVAEEYVSVDWDDASNRVTSADTATGKFRLQLGDPNQVKEIQEGSILTIDVDSAIYLRKVKSVKKNGSSVEVETVQGTLPELLAGSEFVLSAGEVPDTAVFYNTKGKRMRPIEIAYTRVKDEYGEYFDLPVNLATRSFYEYDNSWEMGPSFSFGKEKPLIEKKVGPVTVKLELGGDFSFKFLVGFQIYCNFTGFGEFGKEIVSKDAYMRCKVYSRASIMIGAKLAATAGFEVPADEINDKLKEKFKYDSDIQEKGGVFQFDTSGLTPDQRAREEAENPKKIKLPIDFKFELEPRMEFFAGAEVDGSLHVTLEDKGMASTTFEIQQLNEYLPTVTEFKTVTPKLNFSVQPSLTVGGKVKAKLGAKVGFGLNIFDEPLLTSGIDGNLIDLESQGGFLGTLIIGNEFPESPVIPTGAVISYFNFSSPYLKAYAGISPILFKELPLIGDDLADWIKDNAQWKSPSLIPNYSWEGPKAVEIMESADDIKIGEQNQVRIHVLAEENSNEKTCSMATHIIVLAKNGGKFRYYDKNALGVETGTYGDHYVHCITVSGYESVWWTPENETSTLEARLYHYDGTYESVSIVAKSENSKHESVDMGNGLRWATDNFELDGEKLFGWGDPSGKHKEQNGYDLGDLGGDYHYVGDAATVYGYYGGASPSSDISGSGLDVVRVKWGGDWRIPKKSEWEWLVNNCTWDWDESSKGYWVKSKKTGGRIFLPAEGSKLGDVYDSQGTCEYWSSTRSSDKTTIAKKTYYETAWYLSGVPNRPSGKDINVAKTNRYYRQSIRPVRTIK